MRFGVKIGDWLQHILHHGTRVSGKRDTRIAGEVQPDVVCVRRDEVAHQKKKKKKNHTLVTFTA